MMKRFLTLLALISSTYLIAQIPTAGLIAYYPFNNNANDENPNNPGAHNGTLYGAIPTADRDGNANSAYEFDGVNDYIQVNTTNFGNKFSISLWVNPHQKKNFMDPFGSYKKISFVHYADGHFINAIGTGSSWMSGYYISPTDFYDINSWSHLVMVYDGVVMKAYKDNVLLGTKNYTLSDLTTIFTIGTRYRSGGNEYSFDGFIDDIRIYNVALDASGIDALYNEGSAPPGGTSLWTANGSKIYYNSGNVGIGTTNPLSLLSVDGLIRAEEIKVVANIDVPDYVFEPDYPLRSLDDLRSYIHDQGHLPDIPSAAEIQLANGFELGDMNMRLLRKIEELTLYTIEQEEALREQKKVNDEQHKAIKELHTAINELRKTNKIQEKN